MELGVAGGPSSPAPGSKVLEHHAVAEQWRRPGRSGAEVDQLRPDRRVATRGVAHDHRGAVGEGYQEPGRLPEHGLDLAVGGGL